MRKQSIPGRLSPPTRPGYEANAACAKAREVWLASVMCCMSGSSSMALCARNAYITLYDVTTWSWVNLVNPGRLRRAEARSLIEESRYVQT